MPDYSTYTAEDFALDPYFRRWVQHPDAAADLFWQGWIHQNPGKAAHTAEARVLIEAVSGEEPLSRAEKDAMWRQVQLSMHMSQTVRPLHTPVPYASGWKHWYRATAVFAGMLLTAGILVFWFGFRDITVTTAYGEIKQVMLPDGSEITLNANSSLHYQPGWNASREREVWLDGEAYFLVRHTANHQRFQVHTPDLDVEVLGTEFNVFKRAGKTKVSLNSGKVKIRIRAARPDTLLMRPGDLVEYSEAGRHYIRKTVQPEHLSAWTQRRLVFDNTPMPEIMQLLQDTYGWQMEVKDSAVLAETLTGEIQTDDEATLIKALSRALEVKITRRDKRLMVERLY